MTRITLVGGSTDRFVVDGTEGYLEIEKPLTDKQIKDGHTVGVVFRTDYRAPLDLDEPGHDVTPGHPDWARVEAEKQAVRDADREKAEKAEAKAAEKPKPAAKAKERDKPAAKPASKAPEKPSHHSAAKAKS